MDEEAQTPEGEVQPEQEVTPTPDAPIENETAETVPEQTPEVEESNEDLDYFNPGQPVEVPQFDPAQIQADADGNVDAQAFVQYMNQWQQQSATAMREQARQEALAVRQEEKLWESAIKKYPQLESDRELRDLVHQTRAGAIIRGGNLTPAKAAEQLFKHISKGKEEGAKQATESVRIQASAHLETSDTHSSAKSNKYSDLQSRMRSGDSIERDNARTEYLKSLLADGKL